MTHRLARLGEVVVVALLLVGPGACVAPSADSGSFEANAEAALSSAVSEARTAALVIQARLDGNVTNHYADTVVTDGEMALGPIEDSFGDVDPPDPRDDELRDQVMSLLGDTSDAFAAARIAVRRDDASRMRATSSELAELADRMESARDGLQ